MESLTEHYDGLEQMERRVEDLSDEDWILKRLTRQADGIDAEFVRHGSDVTEVVQ